MAFEIGTADNYLDMADKIRKFICGYGTHDIPAFVGTGSGLVGYTSYERKDHKFGTHPDSVTETWTMTVTNADVVGSEIWSVVGSVSGVQEAATTGVEYINPFVDFEIQAGVTDFLVDDVWSVNITVGVMTTAGNRWVQLHDDGYWFGTEDKYWLFRGVGSTGTDSIYIAIKPHADTSSDYHNLLIYGATGYIASPFSLISPQYHVIPMWDNPIPYWIHCNGRRFVVSTKISTVYTGGYFGFFLPYATPAQYPYPLMMAANSTTEDRQWGYDYVGYRGPFEGSNSSIRILTPDNTWLAIENSHIISNRLRASRSDNLWPTCSGGPAWDIPSRENLDGTRTILPYIITTKTNGQNTYGELDGVGWVSGFGSLSSEDQINVNADTFVVFQGVARTYWNNYWALKLD